MSDETAMEINEGASSLVGAASVSTAKADKAKNTPWSEKYRVTISRVLKI